jgi:hypothetical protein
MCKQVPAETGNVAAELRHSLASCVDGCPACGADREAGRKRSQAKKFTSSVTPSRIASQSTIEPVGQTLAIRPSGPCDA